MSDVNHKHIMRKFYDQLLEEVDPDRVGTHLAQSKTITEAELRALSIQKGRTQTLLRMIADKGPEAYEEFVKALEKCKCFVVYYLLKEGKSVFDRNTFQNQITVLSKVRRFPCRQT